MPRAGGFCTAQDIAEADVFVDLRPVHPYGHEFDARPSGGGGVQQARIPPEGRRDGEGDGEVGGVAVGGSGAAGFGFDLQRGSTLGVQQAIQQLLAGVRPDVAFGNCSNIGLRQSDSNCSLTSNLRRRSQATGYSCFLPKLR